jgi:glycosyltransferase involved in cell wall biosynthesis
MLNRRVCFFNSHKSWGGGEKWYYDMATRLAAKGYNVTVVTNKQSELKKRLQNVALKIYEIKVTNLSFLNVIVLLKIYRIIRKERVDTIIVNLSSDLKAAGIAAKIAGTEKILYARGIAKPVRNSFLNRWLFKRILTGVIANSEETKRSILKNSPALISPSKIEVIYLGIDFKEINKHFKDPIRVSQADKIILGTAGRLEKVKNHKFLIEAAKRLKERGAQFKLLIAGEGSLKNELTAYAKSMGVENEIEFLGFIDDIASFMAAIDVFVLSSFSEGFGYVLIEAMAFKKPVIAFNHSSSPEIVIDQQTGFLIAKNDTEQFVERTLMLLKNRNLCEQFGENGRKRVEEKFTLEMTLNELEKII